MHHNIYIIIISIAFTIMINTNAAIIGINITNNVMNDLNNHYHHRHIIILQNFISHSFFAVSVFVLAAIYKNARKITVMDVSTILTFSST